LTTAVPGLGVGQALWVKLPGFGLPTFQLFTIAAQEIKDGGGELLYTCHLEKYTEQLEEVRAKKTWKEDMLSLKDQKAKGIGGGGGTTVFFETDIILQWLQVPYASQFTLEFQVPFSEPPMLAFSHVKDAKAANAGSYQSPAGHSFGVDLIITADSGGNLSYTGAKISASGGSSGSYVCCTALGRFAREEAP